jgi:hypothetical protein
VASDLDFLLGGGQADAFIRVQKLAPVDPTIKSLATNPIKTLRLLLSLK